MSRRSTGGTESTVMTDESRSTPYNSTLSSRDDEELLSGDLFSVNSGMSTKKKDTTIRLVTKNDWRVSMQIRLEMLHAGKGRKWSKKLRHQPPNPFFEISVLSRDDLSPAG